MPRFAPEPEWRHGTAPKTALVLINLGTPDEPSPAALRRYLAEFLGDPRVVEIPRPLWWLILNGFILTTRPRHSAEKYASIWLPEGSPLKVHTERQTKLLHGLLGQRSHTGLTVDFAMRYGRPGIPEVLDRLKATGHTRILLLPLYPQYAASTTATAFDAAGRWLQQQRNQPEMRLVRSFASHPGYIAALAATIRRHWKTHGRPQAGYQLLMSFHGVPRYTLERGDPYHCECQMTGRLLAEALELPQDSYRICFQSRFGRAEWLQPYTAETLRTLPQQGIRALDVVCPGFPADCLETLEEIAIEGRDLFLAAGGTHYAYIPALNETPEWISALANLAESHLGGWPTSEADPDTLAASARRATALGAQR